MNRNYLRSRSREQQVKLQLEKEGWLAVRAAGSKGIADVIAIRPKPTGKCFAPTHYEVKLVQIKVSERLNEATITVDSVETPIGYVNLELWKFPVKTKNYYARRLQHNKKDKAREVGGQKPTSRVRKEPIKG